MTEISGFDGFAEELRDLAQRFERAAEQKSRESEELVRARDASGQFVSFREAIQIGITRALREQAIPQARSDANRHIPDDQRPQIDEEAIGWSGDRYTHHFYSKNDLVKYHEFGTGEHGPSGSGYVIEPRNEDVLSFYWDKIGQRVAFEYVVHPGVEGKHMLERALRSSTGTMEREIADQIDNMEWDDL